MNAGCFLDLPSAALRAITSCVRETPVASRSGPDATAGTGPAPTIPNRATIQPDSQNPGLGPNSLRLIINRATTTTSNDLVAVVVE